MSASSHRIVGPTCRYGCCGPNANDKKVKRARTRLARRKNKMTARDAHAH